MSAKIAIVILAAGESSRMGRPKQLLPWDSETLINYIVNQTLKVPYDAYFVVLGANGEKINSQLSPDVQVIKNDNWQLGMGSSISIAVKSLKNNFDAIQFVLVDQPQVDPMFLKFMSHAYLHQNHSLIATQYIDSLGIPALFDKKYFAELESLKENGAKLLIQKHKDELKVVKPPHFFEDIDTLEDYKRLHSKIFKKEPSS